MTEETLFERFYLVLWRLRGKGYSGRNKGSWNFIIKDTYTERGFTGSEPGLSKTAFERARAAARRWAIRIQNSKPSR